MADIKFKMKETVGVLSESTKGWTKKLSLVSWNDKEPKYDIGGWSTEHDKIYQRILEYHLQERALLSVQPKAMFLYPRKKTLKSALMYIEKLKVLKK